MTNPAIEIPGSGVEAAPAFSETARRASNFIPQALEMPVEAGRELITTTTGAQLGVSQNIINVGSGIASSLAPIVAPLGIAYLVYAGAHKMVKGSFPWQGRKG